MASVALATTALLLAFNLLFFTMVSSTSSPYPPAPSESPPEPQPIPPTPSESPPEPQPCPPAPSESPPEPQPCPPAPSESPPEPQPCPPAPSESPPEPQPCPPAPSESPPEPQPCPPAPSESPPEPQPCPPAPSESPPEPQPCPPASSESPPEPPPKATCPRDTLKLGACANVLKGLINVGLGKPSKTTCCPLIAGLVDLEAAVCLCTALKANILGINLNVPISLSLLVQFCGKNIPEGFKCA